MYFLIYIFAILLILNKMHHKLFPEIMNLMSLLKKSFLVAIFVWAKCADCEFYHHTLQLPSHGEGR